MEEQKAEQLHYHTFCDVAYDVHKQLFKRRLLQPNDISPIFPWIFIYSSQGTE